MSTYTSLHKIDFLEKLEYGNYGGYMKAKTKYKKLESKRLEYGYTYQQMADMIGVCKSYYWQLEHNNRRLFYDVAKKIASIFNLKPDDLFYDDSLE